MSVDSTISDEHSNDAGTRNGPAAGAPYGSCTGTPFSNPGRRKRRTRQRSSGASSSTGSTWKESAEAAWGHTRELRDYARMLLGVRADRAALAIRRKTTQLAILAALAVVGTAVLVAAAIQIVQGFSQALTLVFGGRAWLGNLTSGLVVLAAIAACGSVVLSRRKKKALEEHLAKYERLHHEHRTRHGRFAGDPEPAAKPPGVP